MSGITGVWVEAGVYNECVADQIIKRKLWNHSLQAHKLAMATMWRSLISTFQDWVDCKGKQCMNSIAPLQRIMMNFQEKYNEGTSKAVCNLEDNLKGSRQAWRSFSKRKEVTLRSCSGSSTSIWCRSCRSLYEQTGIMTGIFI